jgi:chromosomal replication initiation ATPase DnaA
MIQIQRTAELMADPVRFRPRNPNFAAITAKVFGLRVGHIRGSDIKEETARARHAGIWAARECGFSYPEIGEMFNRHHTTCMDSVITAWELRKRLPWYAEASDLILQRARG